MPDAARLVAALCLALLAFIVSGQIRTLLSDITHWGYFTHVNVLLGIICGWVVMGKRAGKGMTGAVNNGLTGGAALLFWGLFAQGGYEMVRLAMRNRYSGPFDAVLAVFEETIHYAGLIIYPSVIWTLLIGSILSGLATEYAWRTWR